LPVVPIAAFLAGALLTLLLPVVLLIALAVWYWIFSARVPETAEGSEPGTPPAEATPGPTVSEALPPEPVPAEPVPPEATPGPTVSEALPPEPVPPEPGARSRRVPAP